MRLLATRFIVTLVVTLAAPAARAEELAVTVTPPALILDGRQEATVHAPGALRWATTVGRVEGTRFLPGPRREPGVAVIAAEDGAGRRGAARLRLVGRGGLKTHTSPGAEVTVIVAGVEFGPVKADRRGDAVVPGDVPPGEGHAIVVAVGREGHSTQRAVELPGASLPPGLLLAPAELAAGARGTITVFAVSEAGGWRKTSAAPPMLVLEDDALVAIGPPRAVEPGRWDQEIEARRVPEGRTALVAATLDGFPLETARIRVIAPRAPAPPAAAPELAFIVGARAGLATAFGPLLSFTVAAEAGVRRDALTLALEVALARGSSDTFREVAAPVTLDQLTVAAIARARLHPSFELLAGAGAAFGSTAQASESSLFLVAGAALLLPLGPGALVLDVRWAEARYDEFALRVDAPALGLVLTAGYRADL